MNRKERRVAEAQARNTIPAHVLAKAVALHQAGNLAEAEAIYKVLLVNYPTHAETLGLLGALRLQQGNTAEALTLLKQSIAIDPTNPRTYHNCGYALQRQKQYADALPYFDKAIVLGGSGSHMSKGNALNSLMRYEEALESFHQALALNADAEGYNNTAYSLRKLGRYAEALEACEKALAIDPRSADAYVTRGNIFTDQNLIAEAVANFDKAIALNPTLAEAYFGKSLARLVQGEFEEGWKLYEWRWKKPDAVMMNRLTKPLWLGQENIAGKTIILHAEQGQGDSFQFCRYLPMVEALGAKVVLGVPSPLTGVIATLKGNYTLLGEGTHTCEYDFQCPLMSLPLALGTTLVTIPAEVPYLFANAEKQKTWQNRLGPKTTKRIGLVWSGAAGHNNDKNRSIALANLAPLLAANAEFHVLQKDVRPADMEFLKTSTITSHADALTDFSETAALIAEMDLVISVDTSVAHLAGALGKPVWILLPFAPDFRWLLDRDDSPWYPTARLFRQEKPGDWEGVIARVKAAL